MSTQKSNELLMEPALQWNSIDVYMAEVYSQVSFDSRWSKDE